MSRENLLRCIAAGQWEKPYTRVGNNRRPVAEGVSKDEAPMPSKTEIPADVLSTDLDSYWQDALVDTDKSEQPAAGFRGAASRAKSVILSMGKYNEGVSVRRW